MKTENSSKDTNNQQQLPDNQRLIGRREALNKAGVYALSAATMMVLMKSQPAMALSPLPMKNIESTTQTGTWQRTTR